MNFENERNLRMRKPLKLTLTLEKTYVLPQHSNKITKVYLFLPTSFSKTGSRTTQFSFTSFEVYSTEIVHSSYSVVESTSTLSYQAP